MNTTRISKQFRWEMGHRLPNHNGLCKNVHGHGYEAHVILDGHVDATGMVMDYFDLKTMVQPIIDELDHCFMVDESDVVMKEFFASHPMKVVELNAPTTAENIASYLVKRISTQFPENHNVTRLTVRVFETEKTYAETTKQLTIRN
ncbi:MAG: 6-carboxytetrahydropterin synthase [Ignavibacteria bacterium]|nr:6-carboxytetrahydropterin synthase [Ignavibacteria bacterium]